MPTDADCLVVGAGIIGLMTARELVRAGRRVTVLEGGGAGGESSWAGAGILAALYPWHHTREMNALFDAGAEAYPGLAAELEHDTGIHCEWSCNGLLSLDRGETAAAAAWYGEGPSSPLTLLGTSEALQEAEPALGTDLGSGFLLNHVAQVRNPRLVRALAMDLRRRGADLREHCPVTGLEIAAGRIRGVQTARGDLEAAAVIVCAGAWSAGLLWPLGVELPVRPMRGQMLLYKGPAGLLRHIILRGDHYLVPRADGRILAGSTVEDAGFDKRVTEAARHAMAAAAAELVPALADTPVELHWAGLRPGMDRECPVIGPCPGIAGLYINTGHFRSGLALAPPSAALAADLVLGRAPSLAPEAFAL